MRVDGFWLLCDDSITRPVFRGEVRTSDGTRFQVKFLADSAADRTVFSGDVLGRLALDPLSSELGLEGIGGRADSVLVETSIQLPCDICQPISITGPFAAFIDIAALVLCVLGRDITNLFGLIIDKPQDIVCLLGSGHRYMISAE